MKILVVDENKCFDLAQKLQAGGHDIRYVSNDQSGENLVVKYSTWKDRIGWSDMVIFTGHGNSSYVEVLKKKNKPVIGVTRFLAQLKEDVVFRNQLLEGLKLRVAPHEYFNDYNDAKAYLTAGKYTLKPINKRMPEYRAESKEDMRAMLDYLATTVKDPEFVLQETVDGVEIEVGAWYNGFKFVRPIANIIDNALRFTKTCRLLGDALMYLDPYLKNTKYVGYVGLKCIVADGKSKPVIDDMTFGMSVPQFHLHDQVMKEEWGTFLFNLSQGSLSTIQVMPRWCYGVKVFSDKVPVFLNDTDKFSHLVECGRVGNHLHATGRNPIICCGHAMSLKEAHRRALDVVDSVSINNKVYSEEHPEFVKYKKLKKWGYLDVSG